MEAMKDIGAQMKAIAAVVRGHVDYDAGRVAASAGTVRDHARSIPDLFPPGSNDDPSEALPNIWDEWNLFSTIASALEESTGALANTAAQADDAEAIKEDFAAVAQTCQSCHEGFRAKK